eukprot:GHRR01029732.1.p1 GENE.GHRR01029732.1~~GHRR01029732.1.p1  ORF type:complete len:140 (-),score=11.41 GHRR01029732.1:185-604(-)
MLQPQHPQGAREEGQHHYCCCRCCFRLSAFARPLINPTACLSSSFISANAAAFLALYTRVMPFSTCASSMMYSSSLWPIWPSMALTSCTSYCVMKDTAQPERPARAVRPTLHTAGSHITGPRAREVWWPLKHFITQNNV